MNAELFDPTTLPPTLGLETAGRMLGIGRSTAYALAATGRFPTTVLRIGRAYRVPTAPLLALLGLTPPTAIRRLARGEEPPTNSEDPS